MATFAGEGPPPEVMRFFYRAYNFILREIGYHGTDQNIISAVIHFDETTPHLQLYYLPIIDKGKKKVYAKGSGRESFAERRRVHRYKQRMNTGEQSMN